MCSGWTFVLETDKQVDSTDNVFVNEKYDVQVIIIPDMESVNFGRGVGYEINEFTPPENIGWISATGIRNSIKEGNNDWRTLVDESIQEDVEKYLTNTEVEL